MAGTQRSELVPSSAASRSQRLWTGTLTTVGDNSIEPIESRSHVHLIKASLR